MINICRCWTCLGCRGPIRVPIYIEASWSSKQAHDRTSRSRRSRKKPGIDFGSCGDWKSKWFLTIQVPDPDVDIYVILRNEVGFTTQRSVYPPSSLDTTDAIFGASNGTCKEESMHAIHGPFPCVCRTKAFWFASQIRQRLPVYKALQAQCYLSPIHQAQPMMTMRTPHLSICMSLSVMCLRSHAQRTTLN